MSIKKTGSSSASSAAKKTTKSQVDNKPKAPQKSKDAQKPKGPEKKDGFNPSKELQDGTKVKEGKDKDKDKDVKKADENKDDKDSLLQKVSDLQKQLDEMKNKKEEKAPENQGGCCGKSSGAKKAEEGEKQDPDSELTQLAVAVMAGGQNPAAGQQPGQPGQPGKPGAKPVGGIPGLPPGAAGNPAQLKGVLAQKYQQYKTQGVQLKKETEQLVQSALGAGNPAAGQIPGQNPLGGFGGPAPQPVPGPQGPVRV